MGTLLSSVVMRQVFVLSIRFLLTRRLLGLVWTSTCIWTDHVGSTIQTHPRSNTIFVFACVTFHTLISIRPCEAGFDKLGYLAY